MRVVVDELNVRENPSTTARRIETVDGGGVLTVTAYPPVESDGYIWYHGLLVSVDGELPPLPHDPRQTQDGFTGWFAAFKGATPYVEQLRPRCPSGSELRTISAMLPAELLECFGRTSIEFEGTYGCPNCLAEIYGEFRPGWLANPNFINYVAVVGTNEGLGINVRFPRDSPGAPADGTIIRVRGHFADAAAEECSISLPDPWGSPMKFDPVPAAVARLWCRQMFVVESYDELGSDPDFSTD